MAFFKKVNNVSSAIVGTLSSGATTLTVTTGEGNNFPNAPFMATIWTGHNPSLSADMELVLCDNRVGDDFDITRAQEGTSDIEHINGSTIAVLVTAGLFNDPTYGVEANILANTTLMSSHIADTSNPHSVDINDVTPTTIKGDLIVQTDTNTVRLPVGTNDYILTADDTQSNGLKWAPDSSGPFSVMERKNYTYSMGSDVFDRMSDSRLLVLMDETPSNGGTCPDYSGKSYSGIYGSAMTADDKIEEAITYMTHFDGTSNDTINFSDRDDYSFISEPFTVGAVIKVPAITAGNKQIISKVENSGSLYEWGMFIDGMGYVNLRLYDSNSGNYINVRSCALNTPGTIYYICCTYDGGNDYTKLRLYRDGVEDSTQSFSGSFTTMHNTTSRLTIGTRGDYSEPYNDNIGCVFLDGVEWSTSDIWSSWLEIRGKYNL